MDVVVSINYKTWLHKTFLPFNLFIIEIVKILNNQNKDERLVCSINQ